MIVRQGLRRILEEAEGIEVTGEAANGVEALKKIHTLDWDVSNHPTCNPPDTRSRLFKNACCSRYPFYFASVMPRAAITSNLTEYNTAIMFYPIYMLKGESATLLLFFSAVN